MKTDVKVEDGMIVCGYKLTESFTTVTKMTPNEARNFKAQLEAALKALAQGDED